MLERFLFLTKDDKLSRASFRLRNILKYFSGDLSKFLKSFCEVYFS